METTTTTIAPCSIGFVPRCIPTHAKTNPRTWAEIVAIEPYLLELEQIALTHREAEGGQRYWWKWSMLKSMFSKCVGWYATKPELATVEAFDSVYSHLLECFETRKRPKGA